jgi:hypothetical protein
MNPQRVGRSPRCSPTTNAIVSNPNTTKFACCTQPPGPASSALTTSATGSYSSSRNNPCTKKVTVNRMGPAIPATALRRSPSDVPRPERLPVLPQRRAAGSSASSLLTLPAGAFAPKVTVPLDAGIPQISDLCVECYQCARLESSSI